MWKKILVPTDFSETAMRAARAAAELAARLGAEIELLHADQPPGYAVPEGFVAAAPKRALARGDWVDALLEDEARALRTRGVTVSTATAMGSPAEAIASHARDSEADLIVMGTHGRTGLRRAILGSVAERVVRSAPCPVLTVGPERGHRAEPRDAAP